MKNIFSYQNLHKKYHHLWYGRCVVLLYHRIINLDFDPQLLAVSIENFESQMELLKQKYSCLTIEEFHQYLDSGKKIPKNSVVITFDDGYRDNFLNALPILERYNFQALFYITTGNINSNKEFWWDEVEKILYSKNSPNLNEIFWGNFYFSLESWNAEKRDDLYMKILPFFRGLEVDQRNMYLIELRRIFCLNEEGRNTHLSMSLEELKEFSQSKSVVIGGHTVNHPSLAHINLVNQEFEIKKSIQFLEDCIGGKIVDFSYPFGTRSNYNLETIRICNELGINYVAANFPKKVDKRSDKFQFSRFLVRNWNAKEFENQLEIYFNSDESFTY